MTLAEAEAYAERVDGVLELLVDCGLAPGASWRHIDGAAACEELEDAPGVFWCSIPLECHTEHRDAPVDVTELPEPTVALGLVLGACLVCWLRRRIPPEDET